jgi:hypothetical protein
VVSNHQHRAEELCCLVSLPWFFRLRPLFPLARTFAMPGLPVKPVTRTPSGPALSKARVVLGEQVMRRIFEIDAARSDADLGISAAWHQMETTAIDGTTIELFSGTELAEAFGVPAGGTKPKIRIAAHVRTASR